MKTVFQNATNKINYLLTKYNIIILSAIFAVFLFSRLYGLGVIPSGIHYDEVGMAFDAKSLANYGTDRHNNSFPLYLPAYGGGQSAMYAYLLALLLKFVPFSMFVMRLPAVFCGCLAFFSSYFLVKDIWKDCKWALLGPVMVTIIPYFMMSERWGLDCNLYLSFATFSFYMFYRAVKNSGIFDYFWAGIALGLTLYTYILSYIVTPLFLLFVFICVLIIRKLEIKKWTVMAIPLFILALPLILMQLINAGYIMPFSVGIFDFPRLGFYRGTEFSLSHMYLHFDKIYKMLYPGPSDTFNYINKFGPVYVVMIPFIILGFCVSAYEMIKEIKRKEVNIYCLLVLFTVAGYISILVIDSEINIYNANELYIMFAVFCIIGLKFINDKLNTKVYVLTPVILGVFALCYLSFGNYYFRHYSADEGIPMMFVSTEYFDVVNYTQNYINPSKKQVYFMCSPEHSMYGHEVIGMGVGANPEYWERNCETDDVENIHLGFPDHEFDLNDDYIYIMSNENYGHIIGYFIEQGWAYDQSFPSYTILYK